MSVMYKPGDFRVVRRCCQNGYCVDCHNAGRVGKPKMIVHTEGVSRAYARWVAQNWHSYAAKAEPMGAEQ